MLKWKGHALTITFGTCNSILSLSYFRITCPKWRPASCGDRPDVTQTLGGSQDIPDPPQTRPVSPAEDRGAHGWDIGNVGDTLTLTWPLTQDLAAPPWWGWRCLATACSGTPSTPPPGWRLMANVRLLNIIRKLAWPGKLWSLVEYSPALIFKFQNKAWLSSALIFHPCVRLSVKLFNYSKNSNLKMFKLKGISYLFKNRYCKCFRN